MFVAGKPLLALEKYAAGMLLNVVPPLVTHVLNMIFCTMGLSSTHVLGLQRPEEQPVRHDPSAPLRQTSGNWRD